MIPDSITDPSSDHRVRSSGEDVHGSAFVVVNPAIAAKQPDGRALRRQAFVDAARDAFFADGYGQTAMSAIASAVGVEDHALVLFPVQAGSVRGGGR